MKEELAERLADAYCDGVCETGLAGICPGHDTCEEYEYVLDIFKRIEPHENDNKQVIDIRSLIRQQVCNSSCTLGIVKNCGDKRKMVCIKYQQALQALGGTQYEYVNRVANKNGKITRIMDSMGTRGWEAFSVIKENDFSTIYFRRRKRDGGIR